MSEVKISVIIPVYNVEKFLYECLESVVLQECDNYEIICVNDGSTDTSLELLQRFKEKNNQMIIINQINKGLPSARNSGINIAKGKYLFFLDSDDYLPNSKALSLLYDIAEKNVLDIVCFNYSFGNTPDILKCKENRVMSGKEMLCSARVNVMSWNKLYKRELLACSGCGFNANQKIMEDDESVLRFFVKAKRVMHIPDVLYWYRVDNVGSITKQNLSMKHLLGYKSVLETLSGLMQEYQDEKIYTFFKRRLFSYIYESYRVLRSLEEKDKEKALKIYQYMKTLFVLNKIDQWIITVEENYVDTIIIGKKSKSDYIFLNLQRKLTKFYIRSILNKC